MNILLDVHTHTVASGHAYSTIEQMAKMASEKGLKILGITDHGPAIPGACNQMYFKNIKVIPRLMYGVELLIGAEINILDNSGDWPMPYSQLSMFLTGWARKWEVNVHTG